MITEQQYQAAIQLVDRYKIQVNTSILDGKAVLDWNDFRRLLQTKPDNRITVGDFVVIPTRESMGNGQFEREAMKFEQVVCTGYCGRDEFWGRNLKGDERYWCEGETYKAVGALTEMFDNVQLQSLANP